MNQSSKTAIVTGSNGYIGGQTVRAFKDQGYSVLGIDWRNIRNRNVADGFLHSNCSYPSIAEFAAYNEVETIVHTAGSSLVGPSVKDPAEYYLNNVGNTASFLKNLADHGWKGNFIFSSSASVYGDPEYTPIDEDHYTNPISPYGNSKLAVEMLLKDAATAYGMGMVALRYFNACGADVTAKHGQEPNATHLVARICENALNPIGKLTIFGNNYPTHDGTCIRDYVHVQDIADAHLVAASIAKPGSFQVYNLGDGVGHSNLEVIRAFEEVSALKVNYEFGPRRDGDPAILVADARKFCTVSGWAPKYSDLATIVSTAYNWYRSDTFKLLKKDDV